MAPQEGHGFNSGMGHLRRGAVKLPAVTAAVHFYRLHKVLALLVQANQALCGQIVLSGLTVPTGFIAFHGMYLPRLLAGRY